MNRIEEIQITEKHVNKYFSIYINTSGILMRNMTNKLYKRFIMARQKKPHPFKKKQKNILIEVNHLLFLSQMFKFSLLCNKKHFFLFQTTSPHTEDVPCRFWSILISFGSK